MKKLIKVTLLSILILLNTETNAKQKKLTEVDGIKIPKGYQAYHDELEDTITIDQKSVWITPNLSFRIKKRSTDTNYYLIVDKIYMADNWLFIKTSTLYIKNGDNPVLKMSVNWDNRQTHVSNGIREGHYFVDKDFEKFIIDNLKEDSEVTIRFSGKQYSDEYISKKQVKILFDGLEFYKLLNSPKNSK